jgi:hypothetical protein
VEKKKGGGELEDRKHKSFDDQDKDEILASLVDIKSVSDDDIKSELSFKGTPIFADQKNLKKLLLERYHKFGHLITTIVKDKAHNKY